MDSIRCLAALTAVLVLALGCAPSAPSAPPSPPPLPTNPGGATPPELSVTTYRGAVWDFGDTEGGFVAIYGPRGGDAIFLVECDTPSNRIIFVYRGTELSQNDAALDIYADGQHLLLAANTQGPAQMTATIAGRDARLNMLSAARGTMLISAKPSTRSLAVPWDESISRVVAACARSEPHSN